jgi:hypothetical protein
MTESKHINAPRTIGLAGKLAFHSMPEPNSGCTLWLASTDTRGYGRLEWNGKQRPAHRLAWEVVHGPVPDGLHVCHKCDVPSCVNPDHLFLGTNAENMADMKRKGRGRAPRGAENPSAKLTEEAVRAIRIDSRPATHIAKDYGVSNVLVGHIKKRKAWKHV